MQNMQSILRNNRLRRDPRSMEDDEAMWFEQDEDLAEEDEAIVPMTDALKNKLDSDFDFQINKILENKKGKLMWNVLENAYQVYSLMVKSRLAMMKLSQVAAACFVFSVVCSQIEWGFLAVGVSSVPSLCCLQPKRARPP